MRSFIATTALLSLAAAAPLEKRALSDNDVSVLQLAHYLENLEYTLYTGGYENFTDAQYMAEGFPAGFREGVGLTAQQEAVHRDTLASVLSANGQTPLPACTYDFPYSDPKTFVALANMITTVGIGAYLGGAVPLMDNPDLLTAASSILTVEARHDSFLRAGTGASPFPTPFDTSLTALWAYNMAHMFVVSCPMELPGQVLLPKLSLVSPMPSANLQPPTPAGTVLNFMWDPSTFFAKPDPSKPLYIAFVNQGINPVMFEEVTMTGTGMGQVMVPEGVSGVAYAALTTFGSGLSENDLSQYGTLAGPVELALS